MIYQHPSNIMCHIILHNNKILKWFILLIWHPFKIPFLPLCCTRWDEQNDILFAYVFKKIKLIYCCFKSSSSICSNWIDRVDFLYFLPSKIDVIPTSIVSSFLLLGAASSPTDVATPLCRVMLLSHGGKMSSLHLLHLPVMLQPIASPLELKSKHWIRTTTTGYLPQAARLPPTTSIKRSSQP
jgi:hypothetical protein